MTPLIKLIIADDHALFRQGLKSLFATYPDLSVIGEVERSIDLGAFIPSHPCDVIVLDLQMDRWVMEDIRWLVHHAAVVVVTASEDFQDAATAVRSGARAVVPKRFALETLVMAIRAAAEGLIWLPPATDTEFAARGHDLKLNGLTKKELAIVRYVADGLHNAEVAERLGNTEGTVKIHLNRIFRRLNVRDRVELTRYAIRHGLIHISSRRNPS